MKYTHDRLVRTALPRVWWRLHTPAGIAHRRVAISMVAEPMVVFMTALDMHDVDYLKFESTAVWSVTGCFSVDVRRRTTSASTIRSSSVGTGY